MGCGEKRPDYREINRRINENAREMARCDPSERYSGRAKTLRGKIMEDMFESLNNMQFGKSPLAPGKSDSKSAGSRRYDEGANEMYYWAMLDSFVPYDLFIDVLCAQLDVRKNEPGRGQWRFSPEGENGAEFLTYFNEELKHKLMGYLSEKREAGDEGEDGTDEGNRGGEKKKEGQRDVSMDAPVGEDGATLRDVLPAESDKYYNDPYGKDPYLVLEGLVDLKEFLELVFRFNESMRHKPNTEAYYRSFFTYDTTKVVKEDEEVGALVCLREYSEVLFPYMMMLLLEYLMEGRFDDISDIAYNKLRPGIALKKRNRAQHILDAINGAGYIHGFSLSSVKNYSKRYKDLLETVKGEMGLSELIENNMVRYDIARKRRSRVIDVIH